MVEEIGEENVVQVITDNASNIVNAGDKAYGEVGQIVVDTLCCSLYRFDVGGY